MAVNSVGFSCRHEQAAPSHILHRPVKGRFFFGILPCVYKMREFCDFAVKKIEKQKANPGRNKKNNLLKTLAMRWVFIHNINVTTTK